MSLSAIVLVCVMKICFWPWFYVLTAHRHKIVTNRILVPLEDSFLQKSYSIRTFCVAINMLTDQVNFTVFALHTEKKNNQS